MPTFWTRKGSCVRVHLCKVFGHICRPPGTAAILELARWGTKSGRGGSLASARSILPFEREGLRRGRTPHAALSFLPGAPPPPPPQQKALRRQGGLVYQSRRRSPPKDAGMMSPPCHLPTRHASH